MKAITGIGIIFTFVILMVAVIMEGGNPAAFINIPAFLIVIGGTMGAMMASTTIHGVKLMPKLAILAMKGAEFDARGTANQMVALSEKARRDGLLALEDDLGEIDDEYTKKGIQLVVDGADSELVRAVLQSEIDGMGQRHKHGSHLYASASGFAPTLGILGTVMSLVHVLENLDNPASLGHSIAGAFLATLYGVGSANLVFLPVANKLKELSAEEANYRNMLLDAVLAIQAGENPRMLGERLETFLPPAARGAAEDDAKRPDAAAEGAPAEEKEAA
jgi:chemotaxis protein MotA